MLSCLNVNITLHATQIRCRCGGAYILVRSLRIIIGHPTHPSGLPEIPHSLSKDTP